MGRLEEIATVALFVASADSSYVNRLELVTDGGTTAIWPHTGMPRFATQPTGGI